MLFDYKKSLRQIRDFFEGTPLIIILVITGIFALSWVADLLGIISYIQESSTNTLRFFIFLIYLFSVVINIYIVLRLRNLRESYIDMENQKAAISDILLQAATLSSPSYKISKWHEKHEIFENGDTQYTRRVIIEYIDFPVQWFEYELQLFEGHKISSISDLNIQVYTINKQGRRDRDLTWAVPLYSKERIRSVVLLHPTVIKGAPLEIEITLLWRGLYKPLFVNNTDKSAITLSRPTDNIEIQLIAPEKFRFTRFERTNNVGKYSTRKMRDGRHKLIFKANQLPEQKYFYWISWEKISS
jgi:hypothetical protein